MRITIGIKIFGIAVGLLILMTVVALLSMRMTRTVDDQLVIIDRNFSLPTLPLLGPIFALSKNRPMSAGCC